MGYMKGNKFKALYMSFLSLSVFMLGHTHVCITVYFVDPCTYENNHLEANQNHDCFKIPVTYLLVS